MRKYNKFEIQLLRIQIGSMLRFARLKKGISQLDLSLPLGTNPTMIGRIERAENSSSWERVFMISQQLEVEFSSLFELKSQQDFLQMLDDSLTLEEKLTQEKTDYYRTLRKSVIKFFGEAMEIRS